MRLPPRGIYDHLDREPPRTLYHYTSLDSLTKIVSGRSLLASDSRFLNDTRELTHLKRTIADRVHVRLSTAEKDSEAALSWLLNRMQAAERDPVYVSSFSANADDLSQWRGYTPRSQGVCIGFSTQALNEALAAIRMGCHENARFLTLGRVLYLGEGEGMTFDQFIDSACDRLNVIEGEVVRSVHVERLIVAAMPFYKHSAFRKEREWRVSLSANSIFMEEDPLPVRFRLGRSSLVPVTHLSFAGTTSENRFIKEVIVGPTPEAELSALSVREFLKSEKLTDVAVTISQIPYRDW